MSDSSQLPSREGESVAKMQACLSGELVNRCGGKSDGQQRKHPEARPAALDAGRVVGVRPEDRLVVGRSQVKPVDRMSLDIVLELLAADLILNAHIGRMERLQAFDTLRVLCRVQRVTGKRISKSVDILGVSENRHTIGEEPKIRATIAAATITQAAKG